MLGAFDDLIERRIREASQRGELDDLPGAGRPLELDDDRLVPEDLRVAYRVLKNAGYVPPEVEHLREINLLLGQALAAEDEQRRRSRRMVALTMALEARGLALSTPAAMRYRDRVADRIGGGERPSKQGESNT